MEPSLDFMESSNFISELDSRLLIYFKGLEMEVEKERVRESERESEREKEREKERERVMG